MTTSAILARPADLPSALEGLNFDDLRIQCLTPNEAPNDKMLGKMRYLTPLELFLTPKELLLRCQELENPEYYYKGSRLDVPVELLISGRMSAGQVNEIRQMIGYVSARGEPYGFPDKHVMIDLSLIETNHLSRMFCQTERDPYIIRLDPDHEAKKCTINLGERLGKTRFWRAEPRVDLSGRFTA